MNSAVVSYEMQESERYEAVHDRVHMNEKDCNELQKVVNPLENIKAHSSSKLSYKLKDYNILLPSNALWCISLWYFFSFTTLFLNKYILSYKHGDPTLLGSAQLIMCCVCGYFHLHFPCGLYKSIKWERTPSRFFQNMLFVGSLRFSTLLMGLVALWFVPVSFAETVKSSAPVFTVFLAWIFMREKTSWLVCFSLVPIMGGLALCSINELSFNFYGFAAAMITNLSECLQNVYSKKLISNEKYCYSPVELQFYTSIASICVQVPALVLMIDFAAIQTNFNPEMLLLFIFNGISFHCQSITEYFLLTYISPVTHSVANTVKRALLIWLSVITFGNKITFLGGLGTTIVIFGVFGYNKAKHLAPTVTAQFKELKEVHSI